LHTLPPTTFVVTDSLQLHHTAIITKHSSYTSSEPAEAGARSRTNRWKMEEHM
jgi:hypothetical protein